MKKDIITDKRLNQHIKKLNGYEYNLFNNICKHTNIDFKNLFGNSRKHNFVNARKIAVHFLMKKDYKLENIGRCIGIKPKDHSTVLYLNKKATEHYELETDFKNTVDSIDNIISTRNFTSLKYKN